MERVIDNICGNCVQRHVARSEYKEWLASEPKDYSDPDYDIKHEDWEMEEPMNNPCVYCTLNNIG